MKLNKELNRELSTSCRTNVMLMCSGIVHFYFHEHSEFTSCFTSEFSAIENVLRLVVILS